jgi:hypothetical protein
MRDGLRRGMGHVTYSQVRANLNARLSGGEFQLVERPSNSPARQFTTAKNRDLAAIDSITPDGRISARLDNGRKVEFDATAHRHFDHGYAVTSHSAQGLTAERVLINADTAVHPDLLNSRFG